MADVRTTTPGRKSAKAPAKKTAAAAAAKPAAPRPAPRAAKPAARPGQADIQSSVTAEERRKMIAVAAYLRAEQRGFAGGDPIQDWLNAEAEIDQILSRT